MERFEAAFIVILLLAGAVRFWGLSDRPLHSDEAVHAHFTFELPQRYIYDPIYHGPFLYHITALFFAVLGTSPFTLRLPQVLFGIGLIALLWPLRKEQYLGKKGVLVSALLLAVSPSLVYYSRFAIHESFFAFFTLGTIVSCVLYSESKKKNLIYLCLAAAMLALLFTAKENAYLVAAIFAVSAFLSFGRPQANPRHALAAVLVFAFVFAFFYSSMFRNPESLVLGITAPVKTWLDKAENWLGHQKPAIFYVSLLVIYELPILLFGLAGVAAGLAQRRNNRFLFFVSLWALLTLAVYLLMKYKTPWQIVHMALPLALMAGAFMERVGRNRAVALIMFALALAFSVAAMARVNFEKSADPAEPLVYVQTSSDVSRLVKIVEGVALEKGEGEKLTISVVSTDYWPLPFYFRNYAAGYWTGDVPAQINADVVLSSTANEKKVGEMLPGADYMGVGVFKLREWYGAGYTIGKLWRFLLDGSGYNSTGSFDLVLYLRKNGDHY